MSYCSYYQAHVKKELCWQFVATLRSFEHVAFDRTLDKEQSLFEFFVSPQEESFFLKLMALMQEHGLVTNLQKLPNRYNDQ